MICHKIFRLDTIITVQQIFWWAKELGWLLPVRAPPSVLPPQRGSSVLLTFLTLVTAPHRSS